MVYECKEGKSKCICYGSYLLHSLKLVQLHLVEAMPSFLVGHQDHPLIQATFVGLRPAVVALVLYGAIKSARTTKWKISTTSIFLTSLLLLLFVKIHPGIVIFCGAFGGVVWKYFRNLSLKNNSTLATSQKKVQL
jgi:chromate transport protein ChrA